MFTSQFMIKMLIKLSKSCNTCFHHIHVSVMQHAKHNWKSAFFSGNLSHIALSLLQVKLLKG